MRHLGLDSTSSAYNTLDLITHGPVLGFDFRF